MKKERIPTDELRGKIISHIAENPGIHYNRLKNELLLANGTLSHNLAFLENNGFIKSESVGIYKKFYPPGYKINQMFRDLSETEKKILKIVRENNGLTQKELGKKLGVERAAVGHHIRKMKKKKILKSHTHGCWLRQDWEEDENSDDSVKISKKEYEYMRDEIERLRKSREDLKRYEKREEK